MAKVRIRHEFSMPAVQAMMTSPTGGIARDMYRRGQKVRSRAQQLVGVDTGRLRASIYVDLMHRDGVVGARVGSVVAYARWHHEGHGIIRPVRAKLLVFNVRGRWVFTKQVGPVEGTEFLRRALPAARD
jgi:hypothetical protein